MIQLYLLMFCLFSPFGLADSAVKPLAYVQDVVITQYDLDQRVKILKIQMPDDAFANISEKQLKQQVLEQMIGDLVQYNEALRVGVVVSNKQVDEGIDRALYSQSKTLTKFKRALKVANIEWKDFTSQFKQEMTVSKLHHLLFKDKVKITPTDIKAYIHKHQFDRNNYLVTSAIIPASQYSRKQAKELKVQWSGNPVLDWPSDVDVNQLEWRGYGDFPQLLQKHLVKLEIGQVSAPIKSSKNYILLRLNNVNIHEALSASDAQRQVYDAQFQALFKPWYKSLLKHTYIKNVSNAL
jgi:peptidyl-prolyl cis-trans isomerase SurA